MEGKHPSQTISQTTLFPTNITHQEHFLNLRLRKDTLTSLVSISNPANPPISSVHDEMPDAAMDTPVAICCNSTSNLESVSPLHKYEQNLCPPTNVLLVSDMYLQEVEAGFLLVRLLNPSSIACWWSHGYIFPVPSWVPRKYSVKGRG